MRKQMLIVIALIASFSSVCYAQNGVSGKGSFSKSIRIGYGFMGGNFDAGQVVLHNASTGSGSLINISADLFRATNSISIGAYLGAGQAATQESLNYPTLMYNSIGLHYGIGLSYSVLENAGFSPDKWDVRLNATIGSYWLLPITPQMEYGAGFSAAYYPFNHWGIYGDVMWGRFLYNGNGNSHLGEGHSKMEIGISYRF